jgi:hypothetical protein
MKTRSPWLLASLALALPLAAACSTTVSSSEPPPPAQGTVVLDWTIGGVKDPDACAQSAVATVQTSVTDASGASVGTFQQACPAFSTNITLFPGMYNADVVMLDSAGNPRTTTLPVNTFSIHGADTLSIPIDFPPSSFLGS